MIVSFVMLLSESGGLYAYAASREASYDFDHTRTAVAQLEDLPLKEGTMVYITGPAADDAAVQCGGWTIEWNGSSKKDIEGVTTIQDALECYADDYGIEIITNKKKAKDADVVLLCVGEQTYAEWNGDTADLELCGALGLPDNKKAIEEAKTLGKPTVAVHYCRQKCYYEFRRF